MIFPTGTLVYDFNKGYYDNVRTLIYNDLRVATEMSFIFNTYDTGDKYWYHPTEGATSDVVGGVTVDNGIDIREYIHNVYNGDQPLCLVDKVAKEILQLTGRIFYELGLDELGDFVCSISQLVFNIIDAFTDLFGTFICTASVKYTDCNSKLVEDFKQFRDDMAPTVKESNRMLKYYTVLGPKVVRAINKDPEKDQVFKYLTSHFIKPLHDKVRDNDVEGFVTLYFKMLNEMVNRYNIATTVYYKRWAKEYLNEL